ncbi:MAG: FAD-linked oxidase C-terminal domain-containing protein, partial [bacterium]
APRSAAGPGFAQLFIGSEGTLGIITEAVMKLHPLPESRLFRGIFFKNVGAGLNAIRAFMQKGIAPAAVRLYDELDTLLIGAKKEEPVEAPIRFDEEKQPRVKTVMRRVFDGFQDILLMTPGTAGRLAERLKGKCLLVLTFEGTAAMTEAELKTALAECRKSGGEDAGEEPGKRWWENRYNVSYNMSRVFERGAFVDTIEVAATWDRVERLYHAVRKAVSPHAFIMAHFSHAYAHGCTIYFSVVGRGKSHDDAVRRYKLVWDAALRTCREFDATLTHHHGVGILKAEWLKMELGGLMEVYRGLKKTLDPWNVLNPGKMGLPEGETDIARLA